MSDAPAADLRCRECGARMQPSQEWCTLCLARRDPPETTDKTSGDVDSTPTAGAVKDRVEAAGEETHHRGHRKRALRSSATRNRLAVGGVLFAVVMTGGAIALSAGRTGGHHQGSPAGKPPAGTTFGVLPGAGTPSSGLLPGRVSR